MRRATLRPGRGFAASPAQREAVRGRPCLVCAGEPVDPAHVVARSLGGCNHPDCVAPLCRRCHSAYDQGRLDLLPHLEPAFRVQLAHAVSHLGVLGALRRISGPGFHPSGRAFAPPLHQPLNEGSRVEVVSDREVLALIAACPSHSVGIRNRAMIAVIWCCGLRTGEALALGPGEVDLEALTVDVRGRTLGLDQQAGMLTEAWLDCRRGLGITAAPVFCTLAGRPLKADYLRELLPRLSRHAGLSRPVSARLLRAAYATALVRDGTPLPILSAALGHASVQTTARQLRRIAAQPGS